MAKIEFRQIGYDAEGEPQFGIQETDTMIRAFHVPRQKPLIKDIADLVGYKQRVVHVVPTHEVPLLNTTWTGTSRVRYRCVNLGTMEMIPLPHTEGAIIRLNLSMAVVAATIKDGTEKPLTIYIRPENVKPEWTKE